ncbi:SHOCT domain-containing protein [Streptomyces sp. NBC_01352]|uniref:SHOCT domain-containing protein n=1 Tax=unclassified Streptomyces TaxID=2593676 RepID=UPI002250C76F|nr:MULTISPECIES: SHOCT domain-containing protein [unclassified Streptomyces]MCX4706124.1 SHOCT domain-containing protein [Streptomyces sp. NBC_01373]
MNWYDHHTSGWDYTLMTLMMLALGAVLIAALVLLLRHPSTGTRGADASPERLLGERFARGEIDDDEYFRRLSVLEHGHGKPPSKKAR